MLLSPADEGIARQTDAMPQDDIVVTGRREKPRNPLKDSYNQRSINSLGALTIGEIIAKLERRTGGRPFSILVNGRRLADTSDIGELPAEALEQIDVLDRSRAGSYGFTPQNDVLNLVLKPKFSSVSMETRVKQPTEGSATSASLGGRYANIVKERRFNAALTVQNVASLDAVDRRRLFSAEPRDPLLEYRTLLPSSRSVTLTAGMAIPIGTVSTSLSGTASEVTSRQVARFFRDEGSTGLEGAGSTVRGIIDESRIRSYQFGATAYGNVDRASWTLELGANWTSSRNGSGIAASALNGVDKNAIPSLPGSFEPLEASSDSASLTAAVAGNAPLTSLPAGEITGNFRLSAATQRVRSLSGTDRDGAESFGQRRLQAHAGVDVPLTNEQSVIGRTALVLNGDYERVSGVGGLPAYDATLLWQPAAWVSLSAGQAATRLQPALASNRDPTIVSPGVLVADAITGQYVLVTRISGGAPDLRASARAERSIRLTFNGIISGATVSATVEYITTKSTRPIILTAYPTPLFQQLFPSRFSRDATGRLTTIDVRPFNGERQRRDVLKPNIHANGRLSGDDGTWDLSIAHEWALSDSLVVTPGATAIDLLATPLDGVQGASRHRFTVDMAASYKRLNLQLGGRWRAAAASKDVASMGSDRIRYGALWTVDGEVSYTFKGGGVGADGSAKPLRLWLSVENIFNRRQRVNDSDGRVPAAFQQAFLDPLGRSLTLRLSKAL